jgi:16S rRNA (adenine1518-N6/adenine1519-N6)-dimethyltransferase
MAQPRAKKSLGQHFLTQRSICERIVGLLHSTADDNIIEIGPGPGALTSILQELPIRQLILLEKDTHWARERHKRGNARTQAVLTDALTMDWSRIQPNKSWKIIGNLPYNVASPLIWDIVSQCSGLQRAVFMVQKEVGERLAAAPSCKDYGGLSVWVQSYVKPTWGFTVGPGAFSPPPKVDSAVLSFVPLPKEDLPKQPEKLAKLIKLCFQQRRKQLGSIFRQQGLSALAARLPELGIEPQLRPENLSPQQFQAIAALC